MFNPHDVCAFFFVSEIQAPPTCFCFLSLYPMRAEMRGHMPCPYLQVTMYSLQRAGI